MIDHESIKHPTIGRQTQAVANRRFEIWGGKIRREKIYISLKIYHVPPDFSFMGG